MTVTDLYAHGGLAVGGSAVTAFVHGDPVASDIEVLWDFGAGLEDVTSFLYDLETVTGRDWPSQLQGKAGPGRLKIRLDNRDNRFSYFNQSSPLNQGGRSLDPGAKIRVQTAGTSDVDPVLLARDRFDSDQVLEEITTDELGTPWSHRLPNSFVKGIGSAAIATAAGFEHRMVLDVGATDYFVQATISELGDNVKETAQQENNVARLIYRWADADNYSYLSYGPFNDSNSHVIEGVDVVAGVETSIYGPFGTVGRTDVSDGGVGDHRRRVTIGVHVSGSDVHFHLNGARLTTTAETALQPAATHVGLGAYWGLGNRRPAIDQIAAWDTIPSPTEGVIWTGTVVDVFPESTPGAPHTVTVTAEGALAQMAAARIEPSAWAGSMRTGVALGDAVERAGLLYPPGIIARGAHDAGSSTDTEIGALAHARKLEEVEAGFLHEAPEGWLVYQDRTHRASLPVAATFSDAGGQFSYQDFKLLQWRRELINRVSAGVSYGSPNFVTLFGATQAASGAGVQRTVDVNLPSPMSDGDLIVVIIVSTIADNDENWLVPLWWVRERDTGASSSKRTQVYTHIGSAAEAGNLVRFYNDSATAGGSYIAGLYQFRDWFGTHEGIAIGKFAAGLGFAGADAEAILPPWGDTNATAFLAHRGGTSIGADASINDPTYPLGYAGGISDLQEGVGSNLFDCGMQRCFKVAMTGVEDPASFTGFEDLQNAEASVIAIRGKNGTPPESRGRLRVTRDDIGSQRRHNTVASYDGTDLFPSEDQAETWCDLMLTRHSQLRPIVRITFTANVSGAYRAQAFRRRLSDRIRVVANQGTGMGIDGEFHIESIAHRWSKRGALWEVTWQLSPA